MVPPPVILNVEESEPFPTLITGTEAEEFGEQFVMVPLSMVTVPPPVMKIAPALFAFAFSMFLIVEFLMTTSPPEQ
jgi:hypothetical protein